MDQTNPLYINPQIDRERMVELYNHAVSTFYMSPATLMRALRHIRSFSDVKKYLTGFRSILGIISKAIFKKGSGGPGRMSHIKGK